jgi:hypothetical protein
MHASILGWTLNLSAAELKIQNDRSRSPAALESARDLERVPRYQRLRDRKILTRN